MSKGRVKSHHTGAKRNHAVKNASKKKKRTDSRASKFKNAELQATLDSQADLLYQNTRNSVASNLPNLPLVESNIHDLTAVLGNL